MKIYTKKGDNGSTTLFGGIKVSKDDERVDAYGHIDELTSYIGLIISKLNNDNNNYEKQSYSKANILNILHTIQKDLFLIMSSLASAPVSLSSLYENLQTIEKEIDIISEKLPELKNFILPNGTEISCLFHIARTVCRRSERSMVKISSEKELPYINRLSDLLFVLARFCNENDEKICILK